MITSTPKVSFIFGTRPEAIKLCPLIIAAKEHQKFKPHVCVTAQHREMLDQILEVFNIIPDVDLSLMQPNQSLSSLTSRSISAIDGYLSDHKPEMIIVQGDTTTTLCASLTAYYHKIPIGHVEAGLRTWNKFSPFPEEINRVLTSHLASIHFTPTKLSGENLLKEGISNEKIFITGNTVIDALFHVIEKSQKQPPNFPDSLFHILNNLTPSSQIVLITGHRRENLGKGFKSICNAIVELANKFSEVEFIYPVHLNPNVQKTVTQILSGYKNIHLIEPLSYLPFVMLMDRSRIILTDSGGVQEEAPSLGKPVLVMRETTERPEAVEMGTVKLVGTNRKSIVDNVSTLLTDMHAYISMANAVNPYGDGKSSERIVSICAQFLDDYDKSS